MLCQIVNIYGKNSVAKAELETEKTHLPKPKNIDTENAIV